MNWIVGLIDSIGKQYTATKASYDVCCHLNNKTFVKTSSSKQPTINIKNQHQNHHRHRQQQQHQWRIWISSVGLNSSNSDILYTQSNYKEFEIWKKQSLQIATSAVEDQTAIEVEHVESMYRDQKITGKQKALQGEEDDDGDDNYTHPVAQQLTAERRPFVLPGGSCLDKCHPANNIYQKIYESQSNESFEAASRSLSYSYIATAVPPNLNNCRKWF